MKTTFRHVAPDEMALISLSAALGVDIPGPVILNLCLQCMIYREALDQLVGSDEKVFELTTKAQKDLEID